MARSHSIGQALSVVTYILSVYTNLRLQNLLVCIMQHADKEEIVQPTVIVNKSDKHAIVSASSDKLCYASIDLFELPQAFDNEVGLHQV